MKKLSFLLFFLFSSALFAESSSSVTEEEAPEPTPGLSGWIDLRPSWTPSEETVHSENEVALEFNWEEDRSVGYTQEFLFVRDSVTPFQLSDGYVWSDFADLISFSPSVSLTYQPRVYFPLSSGSREEGLLVSTQQYLKLHFRLSSEVELALWEIPILDIHRAAGIEGEEGPIANRVFENRVEFGPRLSFFDEGLKIKVPFIWQAIRYADHDPEAAHNAGWAHLLSVAPEVLVRIVGGTYIGVAYYSDSFLSADDGRFSPGEGFRKGVVQAVFQQLL